MHHKNETNITTKLLNETIEISSTREVLKEFGFSDDEEVVSAPSNHDEPEQPKEVAVVEDVSISNQIDSEEDLDSSTKPQKFKKNPIKANRSVKNTGRELLGKMFNTQFRSPLLGGTDLFESRNQESQTPTANKNDNKEEYPTSGEETPISDLEEDISSDEMSAQNKTTKRKKPSQSFTSKGGKRRKIISNKKTRGNIYYHLLMEMATHPRKKAPDVFQMVGNSDRKNIDVIRMLQDSSKTFVYSIEKNQNVDKHGQKNDTGKSAFSFRANLKGFIKRNGNIVTEIMETAEKNYEKTSDQGHQPTVSLGVVKPLGTLTPFDIENILSDMPVPDNSNQTLAESENTESVPMDTVLVSEAIPPTETDLPSEKVEVTADIDPEEFEFVVSSSSSEENDDEDFSPNKKSQQEKTSPPNENTRDEDEATPKFTVKVKNKRTVKKIVPKEKSTSKYYALLKEMAAYPNDIAPDIFQWDVSNRTNLDVIQTFDDVSYRDKFYVRRDEKVNRNGQKITSTTHTSDYPYASNSFRNSVRNELRLHKQSFLEIAHAHQNESPSLNSQEVQQPKKSNVFTLLNPNDENPTPIRLPSYAGSMLFNPVPVVGIPVEGVLMPEARRASGPINFLGFNNKK